MTQKMFTTGLGRMTATRAHGAGWKRVATLRGQSKMRLV